MAAVVGPGRHTLVGESVGGLCSGALPSCSRGICDCLRCLLVMGRSSTPLYVLLLDMCRWSVRGVWLVEPDGAPLAGLRHRGALVSLFNSIEIFCQPPRHSPIPRSRVPASFRDLLGPKLHCLPRHHRSFRMLCLALWLPGEAIVGQMYVRSEHQVCQCTLGRVAIPGNAAVGRPFPLGFGPGHLNLTILALLTAIYAIVALGHRRAPSYTISAYISTIAHQEIAMTGTKQ